jgi:hypothetical protein
MPARRVPASSVDSILLQMVAARRAVSADEGQRIEAEKREAHARQPCACGATEQDWWSYLCHCPEVDEARARLRGAPAGARKAFAGDPAEEI